MGKSKDDKPAPRRRGGNGPKAEDDLPVESALDAAVAERRISRVIRRAAEVEPAEPEPAPACELAEPELAPVADCPNRPESAPLASLAPQTRSDGGTIFEQMGAPAAEPLEPASFPRGFWGQIDYLLNNPGRVMASLRADEGLVELARVLGLITVVMSVAYGAVMGASNLLLGSTMPLWGKLVLVFVTALKVPALFLLSAGIVYSPIYVSNAFMGARHSWRQVLALLLSTTAISATVLASMASVAFFFALTSTNYDFIKLLNVAIFAYAGIIGLQFLLGAVRLMDPTPMVGRRRNLLVLWLLLYIFVGTQLAWVLRPFIGSPNEEFQLFRERRGNFYESVLHSAGRMFVDEDGR